MVEVTATLTHSMGHSETTALRSSPDASGGKNGIQAIASATTYLKRHTGFALLGLEGVDDDDGNASGGRSPNAGNKNNVYRPAYTPEQKSTFDQIVRDYDAIAMYLLSVQVDQNIYDDLYNSGEKNMKMALKAKCTDLLKDGQAMISNIETALGDGDAVLAIENFDCSSTGEALLRRHLGREGMDNLNDLIKIEE